MGSDCREGMTLERIKEPTQKLELLRLTGDICHGHQSVCSLSPRHTQPKCTQTSPTEQQCSEEALTLMPGSPREREQGGKQSRRAGGSRIPRSVPRKPVGTLSFFHPHPVTVDWTPYNEDGAACSCPRPNLLCSSSRDPLTDPLTIESWVPDI